MTLLLVITEGSGDGEPTNDSEKSTSSSERSTKEHMNGTAHPTANGTATPPAKKKDKGISLILIETMDVLILYKLVSVRHSRAHYHNGVYL